ncbi:DUF6057 family protein [uncultured Parabacteroides sp.]|uniref:DUF6057 family protein n=1 Tax=uncultured Parabacteroides sp. TaxID=512312 RepID=UPI0026296C85|nr:DUF6057 family protein [uncultured Parabacteroides sp.]
MNWKQALFWSFGAAAIFYYFLLFGVFLFVRQEEMQLFVPEWWYIREFFPRPGGFCAVAGQWIIQYYRQPMLAITILTAMLVGCGFMIYRLLRCFSDKGYLLFLSLPPVLYLVKMSIHGEYLVDGTVGIFLMLLTLLFAFSTQHKHPMSIAGYGIISTFVLTWLAGLLSVCYAVLYTLFALFAYKTSREKWAAATCLLPVLFICLFSGRLNIPVPLYEGWMPEEYLEIQRLPDYYIYHVWILFTLLVAGVGLLAFGLLVISKEHRWLDRGIFVFCLITMLVSLRFCLPEPWHAQRMMLDELSFLARERQWDAIINKYRGKSIHNYASLNYLNMALAQKGELADRMFAFDQKGVKSLRADWNQTFYMDRLLSDIHFLVGDLALSESFAMDGFTQAKRKGSARMMQRLVQISLIKGEVELARKYLGLLAAMPFYRDWAKRYAVYLIHPERMDEDPELSGKNIPGEEKDLLSLSVPADSLWNGYNLPENRIGWEYRGCYYLLDKRLDAFGRFLEETPSGEGESIPRHFQEAGLLLADKDSVSLPAYPVQPEVAARYREFKQVLKRSAGQLDMPSIYRRFGDTYWFYYYFKIFKGEER